MNAVQKAIFPAILVSSLLMVFLSQLVVPHTTVKASESQTEAAERLHVPLSTLNQKIKRLNIEVRKKSPSAA